MPETMIDGGAVHWRRLGEGPRKAVLLHCSLGHGGMWGGVMGGLGDQITATIPDLPGHGKTADWPEAWPGTDLQALTAEIAAQFCDGPTDLIGHSFGATAILRLALERPELVRSLTLIEPVFFAAAGASLEEMNGAFTAAWLAGDREGAARLFMESWGAGLPWEMTPPEMRAYAVDRIHMVPTQEPVLFKDTAGQLAPGRLEALDRPVLILHGDQSPPVMGEIVAALSARLPRAQVACVEGASHMLPITHAKIVAERIAEHLTAA